MIVELIAHTLVTGWDKMRDAGYDSHYGGGKAIDADELAEFAGRLCYQSWGRPNPATATNTGYLANILEQQHYSVLEHASATFYVAEVSRSFSHELVRHRHLSFSQVSQRYVDESQSTVVDVPHLNAEQQRILHSVMLRCRQVYTELVDGLTAAGFTRKQARQAARSVLPNATETKLVVTGNMRAWREVIAKRISPHADAEMQQFARLTLEHLKRIAPNTFQDM